MFADSACCCRVQRLCWEEVSNCGLRPRPLETSIRVATVESREVFSKKKKGLGASFEAQRLVAFEALRSIVEISQIHNRTKGDFKGTRGVGVSRGASEQLSRRVKIKDAFRALRFSACDIAPPFTKLSSELYKSHLQTSCGFPCLLKKALWPLRDSNDSELPTLQSNSFPPWTPSSADVPVFVAQSTKGCMLVAAVGNSRKARFYNPKLLTAFTEVCPWSLNRT